MKVFRPALFVQAVLVLTSSITARAADVCVANVEHITFPTTVNGRISNFTLSLFEPILECVDVVVDNRTLASAGATAMTIQAFDPGNVLSDSLVLFEMDNGPNGDAALNICFWSDDDGTGTNKGSMCDPMGNIKMAPSETLSTGPMTDIPTKTQWSATLFSDPLPATGLPPECPATNPNVSDCAVIMTPTPEPNTLWTLAVVLGIGVIARRPILRKRNSVASRLIVLCAMILGSTALPGLHNVASAQAPVHRNANDVFGEIGRIAPDFGGMFLDNDNDIVYVYRVRGGPSSAAYLNVAIAAVLGRAYPARSRVAILEGQYSFAQLREWHDRMSPLVLAVPGVVSTDINHAANRIRVGVELLTLEPNILAVLTQFGIPREAVNIDEVSPIEEAAADVDAQNPDTVVDEPDDDLVRRDVQPAPVDPCLPAPCTLRSRVRPLVGGIQIASGGGTCTLGVTATMTPPAPRGLVTASHCTDIKGGVEGTVFYQPRMRAGNPNANKIATEAVDPCYWLGDTFPPVWPPANCVTDGMVKPPNKQPPPLFCPPSIPCRLSDSSFSIMVAGVPFDLGFIARPDMLNPNNCTLPPAGTPPVPPPPGQCSLVWTNGTARFTIVAEGLVVQGDTVDKVGRTTGWTEGRVNIVCGNFRGGGPVVQICQNRTDFVAAGGDSGSPVFKIAPNTNNVTLVGILWGRQTVGGLPNVPNTIFSPIGSISDPTVSGVQNPAHELGPLFKCSTGAC
jgi:hypothetical protein